MLERTKHDILKIYDRNEEIIDSNVAKKELTMKIVKRILKIKKKLSLQNPKLKEMNKNSQSYINLETLISNSIDENNIDVRLSAVYFQLK